MEVTGTVSCFQDCDVELDLFRGGKLPSSFIIVFFLIFVNVNPMTP